MSDKLAEFSAFLDDAIEERLRQMSKDELIAELLLLHRTIKVVEEVGEVVGALIGMTGANPRKGVTHTREDLVAELHDVAVSVEGAVEHVEGNQGWALEQLGSKVAYVHERAGLRPRAIRVPGNFRPIAILPGEVVALSPEGVPTSFGPQFVEEGPVSS